MGNNKSTSSEASSNGYKTPTKTSAISKLSAQKNSKKLLESS